MNRTQSPKVSIRSTLVVYWGAVVCFGACLGSTACRPYKPAVPAGFAAYDSMLGPWRAVHPSGAVLRVRTEDNDPKADLVFWRAALKKRMDDAGYTMVGERDIKADGRDGYLLELAAPLGPRDFSYLVGLFVIDDDLVVIEAAAPANRFAQLRPVLASAIEATRF